METARMKIQSPLSVEECVTLLKNATVNDSLFGTMFISTGTIICKINGSNFRLRQKRSYGNSFGPYFYGKLSQIETGTEISGEFRIHPFVITFMSIWFGCVILIGGIMAVASFGQMITGHYDHAKSANPLVGIIVPVIMLVFGAALVKFGKLLGRAEEVKMTSFLQETFAANKAPSLTALAQSRASQKISMTVPMLFFAAVGVLSFVSSFTGISSYHASASSHAMPHTNTVITYYHDQWGRWLALANGVFLVFMAYGIWKRLYLIWQLGFVLIALSAVSFIFNVLGDPNALPQVSGKHSSFSPFSYLRELWLSEPTGRSGGTKRRPTSRKVYKIEANVDLERDSGFFQKSHQITRRPPYRLSSRIGAALTDSGSKTKPSGLTSV
jgi:hypothetical protein